MFALDSNAVIHALKGMGRVREAIERIRPSDLAVPAVVAYEIEVGTLNAAHPEARWRDVQRLFSVLTILPFDGRAASRAAQLLCQLERTGHKIGPLDTLIAGTVLAHGAILVTRNTAEFSRVPGLRVENWY